MELERIKTLGKGGYYLVKKPPGFPGNRLYPLEHRVVWWLHYGSLPPDGWNIHHINGDPKDNRIENLEALTAREHSKDKHNGGKEPATYRNLKCKQCNSNFQQLERTVNFRESRGQVDFFCNKSCQVIYANKNRTGIKLNYPKNRKSSGRSGVTLICNVCQIEYYAPQYKKLTSKTCSKQCSNKFKTLQFKK